MRKYLPQLLIGWFCSLTFLGCNSGKYSAADLPDQRIEFGDGGGFTGAVRTFTLLENGQLFEHQSLDNSTIEHDKVRRKRAVDLFQRLEAVDWEALPKNAPGNRYYFLRSKGADKWECVWGSSGAEPPLPLQAIYYDLQALVKSSEEKM